MANQDFLITFSVDGTQAIRMMEQIGQRATALEARLNALGRGVGAGGVTGGILANLGLAPGQVGTSVAAVGRLQDSIANLSARRIAGAQIGLPASAAALKTEALASQVLANKLGATSVQYKTLTASAAALSAQSRQVAQQTDATTQSFGRHTHRIFEAILIYEAFGRAVQAVQAGVGLIIDIDRESRRLEAVLEIDPTRSAQFVRGLGEIASETVTPFADLVSEADRASAAFLGIEDPAQRSAAALELMENAGKLTTVTQRGLGVEVNNLIAIMKQLGIEVEDLDDFLGKIVVAGGNSSTVIAALTDALQLSSRAARDAGVDLDTLLAIEAEFIIQTGRTGTEVGNTFRFLFARLTDPDVVDSIDEITGGLLRVRDAIGAIRDPIAIMLELKALFDANVLSATQFNDVIDKLTLLNPGAKTDFRLIVNLLGDLGNKVRDIGQADVTALDELVRKINDALGPQFQKLIIDAQIAFVNMFSDDILEGGQGFIDLIRDIGSALATLQPGVLETIVKFGTFLVAIKVLTFAIRGLITITGVGGLLGTLRTVGSTVVAMAGGLTAASGGMTLLGRAAFATTGLIIGLGAAFAPLLVAIAAFMAIDFISKINEAQAALKGQIGASLTGLNREELLARRAEIMGELVQPERPALDTAIASFTVNPALRESLAEIDRLLLLIGADGEVVGDQLSEGFNKANDAITDAEQSAQFLANLQTQNPLTEAEAAAQAYAESLAHMTEVERDAAEAAQLLTSLMDEQGDALLKLNERFKEGEITQAQYTQGQTEIQQAADIATRLVATFGDQLRTLIPILGGAGEGNEALAAALFDVIIQSSNGIPSILNWANAAIAMAQGASKAAIATISAAQAQLVFKALLSTGSIFQALKALNAAAAAVAAIKAQIFATTQSLSQLFARMNQTFATIGSTTFGTGLGAAAKGPDRSILDIGDLTQEQLQQAIQLAFTLQANVPGASAEALDDLISVIKDAQFLQLISGLDQQFLQIAIEELTEQMEEANRLAAEQIKREALLQNLVVNAGPLSALVSQPTLFGLGGSITQGGGLNFDPTKGNFVINVPIEWTGFDLTLLQQLIYDVISQAIRDAQRL